jgi:hypothetical protein
MDSPQYKPSVLFWSAALAAAAMVVGGFGPWATALGFSATGTERDGWIVILVGLLVAALMVSVHRRSFVGKATAASLLFAGSVVAVITVYDINQTVNVADGGFLHDVVIPGWGLYMALAAGISLSVLALAVLAGEVMFEPVPGQAHVPRTHPSTGGRSSGTRATRSPQRTSRPSGAVP